jgi:hypothetical protein
MTARNTSLIVKRFRTSSTHDATRARRLGSPWAAILLLLSAILLAPLASQAVEPTEGREVSPSTSLWNTLIVFFHGPENTDWEFLCEIEPYATPSSIGCHYSAEDVGYMGATLELVGIAHDDLGVTGHRVYAVRQVRGKTYHYEGALSSGESKYTWPSLGGDTATPEEKYRGALNPFGIVGDRWIAGSYTVTSREWRQNGRRLVPVTVTRGPYPFTALTRPIANP